MTKTVWNINKPRWAGGLLLAFWLALAPWLAPALAQDTQANPSSEDKLLDTETEVNTEEWKKQVEQKFREMPLEPEAYSVVGAKHPQTISQAPAAISVLDENDIRAYSVSGPEELLRIVPGMDVVIATPAFKQVGIRGFFPVAANTILVLLDGREVNVNFLGGVFWNLLPITIDDIKRIEIIRGPGSALYGANAYSGVINIITKDPRDERRADGIAEISGYNRELGAASVKAKFSQVWENLGLKASADYNDQRSYNDPREISTRTIRTYLRSHYEPSGSTRLDLDAGFLTNDSRYYTYLGELPVSDASLGQVNLFGNWEKLNFKLGWSRYDFKFAFDSPLFPEGSLKKLFQGVSTDYPAGVETNNLEAGLESSLYLGTTDRLTVGANYILNIFASPALVKEFNQENRIGTYLQNEWSPVPPLSLILGLRYDYNSQTKQDLSPRLSIVYSLARNHALRASFARAFRKPSFFEYGINVKAFEAIGKLLNPGLGGRIIYSPDLGNEHINSFELGYNSRLFRRLDLSANFFYNQHRDIISFDNADLVYVNYSRYADSFGGEIALNFIIHPRLKGFVNSAFLGTQDLSQHGEMKVQVERYSKYKANLGVNWLPFPGFSFSLIGNLIGPKRDFLINPNTTPFKVDNVMKIIPTQFLLGINSSYSFLGDRAEVGVKVFNLLDDNRRQYPGDDWDYDLDGDGNKEKTNFGGERLCRTITGFARLSW